MFNVKYILIEYNSLHFVNGTCLLMKENHRFVQSYKVQDSTKSKSAFLSRCCNVAMTLLWRCYFKCYYTLIKFILFLFAECVQTFQPSREIEVKRGNDVSKTTVDAECSRQLEIYHPLSQS